MIRVTTTASEAASTRRLREQVMSPLTGIVRSLSFVSRSSYEPRVFIAGGEICNVESWRHQSARLIMSNHIGGGGILYDEPLIKGVAEALERYGMIKAAVEESARCKSLLLGQWGSLSGFPWFSDRQYKDSSFPFLPPGPEDAYQWLELDSASGSEKTLVPAQAILVGYQCREGEPRLIPGVTTGTAVHFCNELANINALIELIQVDAVMGHWYTADYPAVEILLDQAVSALQSIVTKHFYKGGAQPRFFWIPTVEGAVHVVVTAVVDENGPPFIALGQGADINLERAMYKSLIEGVGVLHLAKITAIENGGWGPSVEKSPPTRQIFTDLDSNVLHYATRGPAEALLNRLETGDKRPSSEVSRLVSNHYSFKQISDALRDRGIRVFSYPIEPDDLQAVGLYCTRLWSPDLIPLCIPSFPNEAHPRYEAYGGYRDMGPHPYP